MYTGQPDVFSFLLYTALGLLSFFCVRMAMRVPLPGIENKKRICGRQLLWLGALSVALVFVATFREVGYKLGGADSLNYINIFLHSNDSASPFSEMVSEPVYLWYCQLIRLFTDNYRIFFAITYGIIVLAFCLFIKKFCPRQNIYYSPFILLIYPYLKGLCTLRSTFAVAFLLLGLVIFSNKKLPLRIIGCLVIILSFTIHRMSIALVPIFVFYGIYRFVEKSKFSRFVKGTRLAIAVCILILMSYFCARGLQALILTTGLLKGNDFGYIANTAGNSIFSTWLTFAPQALLAFFILLFDGRYEETENIHRIKIFCLYDVIILPAATVLGFWRVNEYFYIARLIMWGVLAFEGEKLIPQKLKKLYRVGVFALFMLWLVFRIYSEWDSLKIMPYIFSF